MAEAGTIKLCRARNLFYRREANVLIDGKNVGNVSNGETRCIEVDSGTHKIQVKDLVYKWKSQAIDCDVLANSSIELVCGISLLPTIGTFVQLTCAVLLIINVWARFSHEFFLGVVYLFGLIMIVKRWAPFPDGIMWYLKKPGT